MKLTSSMIALALGAALAACSHEEPQQTGQMSAQAPTASAACPISQLRGVRASVTDIKDGVAITFTAPEDQLDALRKGVHAMADSNDNKGDAFAVCPCASTNLYGATETMPGSNMPYAQPRADSKVEDIPTGVVLKLSAKDKGQAMALRTAALHKVESFKSACLGQTE
jgi:hypothetical protein